MEKVIVYNATTGKELLWRSIKIRKSLDEICHTLELELSPSEKAKVKRHNRLKVICANRLDRDFGGKRCITTVLVDEVTSSADISKSCLMVLGRSPARDIIDSVWSDHDDFSFASFDTEQTLKMIATKIAEKFNIRCDTFGYEGVDDPTEIVPYFLFENESPWTKLIDEADNQGYIFTSNEEGNLYLWKAGAGNRPEPFYITEGINARNIRWTENGAEQFHEYVLKGMSGSVHIIDNTCPGNRVLNIVIIDPFVDEEKLRRRAEVEMHRRQGDKVTVTVSGLGLTDAQIESLGDTTGKEIYWSPNLLIPVRIPSLGLNKKLLISEVEYKVDAEAMSCDLTLVNREEYVCE